MRAQGGGWWLRKESTDEDKDQVLNSVICRPSSDIDLSQLDSDAQWSRTNIETGTVKEAVANTSSQKCIEATNCPKNEERE